MKTAVIAAIPEEKATPYFAYSIYAINFSNASTFGLPPLM